jgi:hypothetical protein
MKVKMAVSGQKIAMMPSTIAIAPRSSALFHVIEVGIMGCLLRRSVSHQPPGSGEARASPVTGERGAGHRPTDELSTPASLKG